MIPASANLVVQGTQNRLDFDPQTERERVHDMEQVLNGDREPYETRAETEEEAQREVCLDVNESGEQKSWCRTKGVNGRHAQRDASSLCRSNSV